MHLRKTAVGLAVLLAGINSSLYYFVFTLSFSPQTITEPWLLNQGYRMYIEVADNHAPLMPMLLALGQLVIPDGLRLAKLTLAGLIFLSALLTFFAARKLAGSLAGILAVVFFVCWSQFFGSYKLWYETFLTPLYALLILLWSPPGEKPDVRRLGVYGIILGISLLVKQQALFLIAGMVSLIILLGGLNHKSLKAIFREVFWIEIGIAVPIAVFFAYYLLSGGSWLQFWYWVVGFNDAELGRLVQSPLDVAFLWAVSPAFILLVVFLLRFLRKLSRPNAQWGRDAFLLLVFLAGIITAYPRWGTFHLQPMLPVLAIFSGLVLAELASILPAFLQKRIKPITVNLIIAGFVLLWIVFGARYAISATQNPRKIYEYSDLPALADQIHRQLGPNACVYIMPEDEALSNLHYLLKCPPPRFWIFTAYPWSSRDGIPEMEIAALQAEAPQWVLYFPGRWEVQIHDPKLVNYVESTYQKVGQIQSTQGDAWLMKKP